MSKTLTVKEVKENVEKIDYIKKKLEEIKKNSV
ncbi:MAG: hypothetical protein KQ78_00816 [Candidatus Izimaplasma bacterium HR2]|nr:MAG: hypothetical protein KQ78_00816 [Candidatus Izimaplasma bacterium HR2]